MMKPLLLTLVPLAACAAGPKFRAPASDAIPKCWKVYDPQLHDGLYRITIPANDSVTAKDVQTMLLSLQSAGVASHSASASGDTILLEAQFVSLDQGRGLGYPTQAKLEELVEFTLRNDVPFLEKGVNISCFKETARKHH